MPSSSAPPPQPGSAATPWWLKVLRFPGGLWRTGREAAEGFINASKRRPSRLAAFALRLVFMVSVFLLAPLVLLLRTLRSRRRRASDALYSRVREIWASSPYEAVALLRSTVDKLKAAGFDPLRRVDVPPFGRFDASEGFYVFQMLVKCERTLGRYEEALQVSLSIPVQITETILEQVDCLMEMGRRADAIAHLEKNLGRDTWRGPLRRRLEELSGKSGAGVN